MTEQNWTTPAEVEHQHRMAEEKAQHEHELALERERTARERIEHRHTTLRYYGGGFATLLVLGVAAFLIFTWTTGPESDKPTIEERRELACIESGGGWVPETLLDTDADQGLCVHPGDQPGP